MHFSCLTAGTLLARLGRPEVSNCIAGLKQYGYAYEEAVEEAVEMERVYAGAMMGGESDIVHMASVVGVGVGRGGGGAGSAAGGSVVGSSVSGTSAAGSVSPTLNSHAHQQHQPMTIDASGGSYGRHRHGHSSRNGNGGLCAFFFESFCCIFDSDISHRSPVVP